MGSAAIRLPRPMGVVTWAATVVIACGLGCRTAATTGGDVPVTVDRLEGSRLLGLQRDVTWTFVGGHVTIGSAGRPIPRDVFGDALATHPAPKAIEARWTLDPSAGILRLSEVIIDGDAFTDVLEVPIRPAGQVRVTLGERQYNLVGVESRGSGSSDPRRDP